MIRIPFDDTSALLLLALGYTQRQVPAHWEDTGDAENGPRLDGHNEYDVWTRGDSTVIVSDGHVVEVENDVVEPWLDDDDHPFMF